MMRSEALRAQLDAARDETDRLFGWIAPEALYDRPIPERHRLIFYLGHFEAFDWNVLGRRSRGERPFHPEFDVLFERGIDPAPGQAQSDLPEDWPAADEVLSYNRRARDWLDRHFAEFDPDLVQMVIEHRLMHAETFAYLMHNMPFDRKAPGPHQEASARPVPDNPLVRIEASTVTLGKRPEGFGWDNEHLSHEVRVPEFSISKYKVSNGEYLEFVQNGGPVPNFWTERDGDWFFRGMFNEVPLPLDRPVWVTFQQASAYAAWRGLALPSEAQWQLASGAGPKPSAVRDNFGFVRWDPVPVDASNGCSDGPSQLVGNGWEWTRDIFAPFPGFEPHPFYPGYSADFFDGRHYVMRGASPRTATLLTRPTFRNWFRPDYPYMYAGFRLVED
jgi:formylglycine-generating enzyme required for sulfatase activity